VLAFALQLPKQSSASHKDRAVMRITPPMRHSQKEFFPLGMREIVPSAFGVNPSEHTLPEKQYSKVGGKRLHIPLFHALPRKECAIFIQFQRYSFDERPPHSSHFLFAEKVLPLLSPDN
jgi:hypothetical protein